MEARISESVPEGNQFSPGRFNPLPDEITKYSPGRFNPLSDEITKYIFTSLRKTVNKQEHLSDMDTDALQNFQKSLSVLSLPPKFTTLRVNLEKISLENAITAIKHHLLSAKNTSEYLVYPHHSIQDLLIIESPISRKLSPQNKEIIVDQRCGSAVLRGADIFAPGILGASPGLKTEERVAIYADLDGKCLRGSKGYKGQKMFVGNGTALISRLDLFRTAKPTGKAVIMDEKLFDCPSLGDFRIGEFFLQNLPSVICSHILKPEKNGVVLDMCAAPGGKATHLAVNVGDSGHVIAIDRSQNKVNVIKENAIKMGLLNISAFAFDSTKLVLNSNGTNHKKIKLGNLHSGSSNIHQYSPPYQPFSFRWILLDAPCSALGQRPQIQTKRSLKELQSFPVIQRKLLENAVQLLEVGGVLLYSTCTILVEENEMMVAWVLKNFKQMELIDSEPKIGHPGLMDQGLNQDQCRKVQRFGPHLVDCENHDSPCGPDNDTIGFFIAVFKKTE